MKMGSSQDYSPPTAFDSLMAARAGGHMERLILPALHHDERRRELLMHDDHNLSRKGEG